MLVDQWRHPVQKSKPADMKQDVKLLMATQPPGRGVTTCGGKDGAPFTLSSVFFLVWNPVHMWF